MINELFINKKKTSGEVANNFGTEETRNFYLKRNAGKE